MPEKNSATVICFASAKGGSGKTVSSSVFGYLLSGLGKRVLLVDMDAATNGMTLLFMGKVDSPGRLLSSRKQLVEHGNVFGLYEVAAGLEKDKSISFLPTIFQIQEGLDMAPTTYVTRQTEGINPAFVEEALDNALNDLGEAYDYILLDAQAGTDDYSLVGIKKTVERLGQVIIVSEYDYISSLGIARLQQLFPSYFPPERTWILFNKMLPEFSSSIGEILSVARYLSPIAWNADVVRAFARGKLALDMDNPNSYTMDVVETVESLLGSDIEEDIVRWKSTKSESIRAPARKQLAEVEEQLLEAQRNHTETEVKIHSLQNRKNVLSNTPGTAVVATIFAGVGTFNYLPIDTAISVTGSLALLTVLIFFYAFNFSRRWSTEISDLGGQSYRYQLEMEDLRDRRQNLRVRVEGSLDALVRQGSL